MKGFFNKNIVHLVVPRMKIEIFACLQVFMHLLIAKNIMRKKKRDLFHLFVGVINMHTHTNFQLSSLQRL